MIGLLACRSVRPCSPVSHPGSLLLFAGTAAVVFQGKMTRVLMMNGAKKPEIECRRPCDSLLVISRVWLSRARDAGTKRASSKKPHLLGCATGRMFYWQSNTHTQGVPQRAELSAEADGDLERQHLVS